MDIHLPGESGIACTARLKAKLPGLQVIMLTVSDHSEDLVSAIESGAYGYLLKSLDSQSFIASMRGLEEGKAPISGEMTSQLLAHIAQQAKSSSLLDEARPVLSEREIEIMKLIARGLKNKSIAEELQISENTVKYHLKHILQKLNLKNRAEAAAYSVQSGLSTPKTEQDVR
jgi:two-component system nitrate/nitrite response regulator NarL